jgi:hypothetical protein
MVGLFSATHASYQTGRGGGVQGSTESDKGDAFYAETIPGFFTFIGHSHEAEGCTAPNHSPPFKVHEDVLPLGVALHRTFATEWLQEHAAAGKTGAVSVRGGVHG